MDHHDHSSSMMMFFHYGYENNFLFQNYNIDSPFKMWLTCGLLFALGVIYEAIKYFRCVHCGCVEGKRTACNNGGDDNGNFNGNETGVRMARNCYVGRLRSRKHKIIQSLIHVIQAALAYLLMISAMYLNVCLIFAILMGYGVGFYVFYRSYNEIEAIDNCH